MCKVGVKDEIEVEEALVHLTSDPVNMTHSKILPSNNIIIITIVTIVNGKLIISI